MILRKWPQIAKASACFMLLRSGTLRACPSPSGRDQEAYHRMRGRNPAKTCKKMTKQCNAYFRLPFILHGSNGAHGRNGSNGAPHARYRRRHRHAARHRQGMRTAFAPAGTDLLVERLAATPPRRTLCSDDAADLVAAQMFRDFDMRLPSASAASLSRMRAEASLPIRMQPQDRKGQLFPMKAIGRPCPHLRIKEQF